MQPVIPMTIGPDALRHLRLYCQSLSAERFTLVCDTNTYAALGQRVEETLDRAGLRVSVVVLPGDEVVADERYLVRLLVQAPPGDQVFLAVGSGTITDITRYIAFRTRNPFISVPTAASVDGFLSSVAPLVVDGLKETCPAQGPIAVFAELEALAAAPARLRAAGFGDVLGKATALADWELGRLLWGEPHDAGIARRVRAALTRCFESADAIGAGSEPGVRTLMEALLETGLCMLEFGDSRPASGAEHHCSHYWEMQLLMANRPAILHGAKVGYAATLVAQLYDQIRGLSQDEARILAQRAPFAGHDAEIAEMTTAYGPSAGGVLRIQAPFLALGESAYADLQQRIVAQWPAIQAIAQTVPASATLRALLDRAGAPSGWRALGLDEAMVRRALRYGHYLRSRFTVIKLCRMLGIDAAASVEI